MPGYLRSGHKINEDIFIWCQQLQDQSHDPIPTCRDTNNVLSATAASSSSSSATDHDSNTTVNDVRFTNYE